MAAIDLKSIPDALEYVEGFSRVHWDRVAKVVNATAPEGEPGETWGGVALQWVGILRDELGGSYRISESDDYVLLSEYNAEQVKYLLGVTAKAHSIILVNLGHLAATGGGARDVLLLFSDLDDYDQYIAYFYQGAHIPQTGGVYLNVG